jgi:hypothetical protein
MKPWKYLVVGTAIAVAFLLGLGLGIHLATPGETSIAPEQFTQYSLLTWKGRSNEWCFALMLEYQRGNFLRSWTSKWGQKCGVEELKKALSALPKDTYVYWNTWPPRNCDYPEKAIVQDVVTFAANKGVHVQLLPALQATN